MLFEVSLMLRVCLTVDGIPHEVSAIFSKGVFPWFCHFQENQGVLGLMGGSRNDPFPNSTPYPIPLLRCSKARAHSLSASPLCSCLCAHLPLTPLSKPKIIHSHNQLLSIHFARDNTKARRLRHTSQNLLPNQNVLRLCSSQFLQQRGSQLHSEMKSPCWRQNTTCTFQMGRFFC